MARRRSPLDISAPRFHRGPGSDHRRCRHGSARRDSSPPVRHSRCSPGMCTLAVRLPLACRPMLPCIARISPELIPSSVLDRLVEASFGAGAVVPIATVPVWLRCRTTRHVCYLQVFQIDGVVLSHQVERHLVVEVGALSSDLLVLLEPASAPPYGGACSPSCDGRRDAEPSSAPVLPCDSGADSGHLALGGNQKHLEPNIDTSLLTAERQGLYRHVDAGETHVPPSAAVSL